MQSSLQTKNGRVFVVADGTGTFKIRLQHLQDEDEVQKCQAGDWVAVVGEFRGLNMHVSGEALVIAQKVCAPLPAKLSELVA